MQKRSQRKAVDFRLTSRVLSSLSSMHPNKALGAFAGVHFGRIDAAL